MLNDDVVQDVIRMYEKDLLSMNKISKIKGISVGTVFNILKKNNIKTRDKSFGKAGIKISEERKRKISLGNKGKIISIEARKKISAKNKGKRRVTNNCWGTHTKKRGDGYISVYVPEHPFSNKQGYVMEHRLVVEKSIGRYLTKEETVHHINRNRSDNRLENLILFENDKKHMEYHMKLRERDERGRIV